MCKRIKTRTADSAARSSEGEQFLLLSCRPSSTAPYETQLKGMPLCGVQEASEQGGPDGGHSAGQRPNLGMGQRGTRMGSEHSGFSLAGGPSAGDKAR